MNNLPTGKSGEDMACKYLKGLGYKIIERNYRIRGGEIDIIARDKDYLVFVEVKARYSHNFGSPAESITPWKIKALKKTALFYNNKIRWGNKPYRFDLVTIDYSKSAEPYIELIENFTF